MRHRAYLLNAGINRYPKTRCCYQHRDWKSQQKLKAKFFGEKNLDQRFQWSLWIIFVQLSASEELRTGCNKLTSQYSLHSVAAVSTWSPWAPLGEKKHTLTQCDISTIPTIYHLHMGPCCSGCVRHLTWCTFSTWMNTDRSQKQHSVTDQLRSRVKLNLVLEDKLYRSEEGQLREEITCSSTVSCTSGRVTPPLFFLTASLHHHFTSPQRHTVARYKHRPVENIFQDKM